MTDQLINPAIRSWLRSADTPPLDPTGSVHRAMRAIGHTQQVSRSRLWPRRTKPTNLTPASGTQPFHPTVTPATNGLAPSQHRTRRSLSMSSAVTLITATVVLALTGSFFAVGLLPQDEPALPAALATASPTPDVAPSPSVAPPANTVATLPEPEPWVPPVVEPDPTKRLHWPATSVVLEADDLRIEARGKTFKGVTGFEFIQSYASIDSRNFDVQWGENGREMRMNVYFESDGTDYWVSEWQVYDGAKNDPDWVYFKGPLFVTPLGQPMEADVVLTQGKGKGKVRLVIDGMRITAFHPGSGPAPLTGCTSPVLPDAEAIAAQGVADFKQRRSDEELEEMRKQLRPRLKKQGITFEDYLLDRFAYAGTSVAPPRAQTDNPGPGIGEPLLDGWEEPDHQFKGTGIWTMSLPEVETLLRESGVCFEFNYSYFTDFRDGGGSVGGERWCTAPPRGHLTRLSYRDDVLVGTVRDEAVQAQRQVPPQGWNCPTN